MRLIQIITHEGETKRLSPYRLNDEQIKNIDKIATLVGYNIKSKKNAFVRVLHSMQWNGRNIRTRARNQ